LGLFAVTIPARARGVKQGRAIKMERPVHLQVLGAWVILPETATPDSSGSRLD